MSNMEAELLGALGRILSEVSVGASIDTRTSEFRKVSSALEFVLPFGLKSTYDFWREEAFDEFRFSYAVKTDSGTAAFVGLALLIRVQQWVAISLTFSLASGPQLSARVACKVGEPGHGAGGMATITYDAPQVSSTLVALPARVQHVSWVYEAKFSWPYPDK
jgi:hypothetical protein